jgi:Xaa-Pro aminopeptidase
MTANDLYRRHRAHFLELLARESAAAIVPTAVPKIRNHDSEYRFRPESDFWYLTGFNEPDSVLVLLPGVNGSAAKSVLFLRDKKREEEIWTGLRLGVAAAPAALGVDEAYPIGELWTRLPDLLKGYERVVYRAGADEARDRALLAVLAKLRAQVRSEHALPMQLFDPAPWLHELRLFKGEGELALMRRAAAITAEAHVAAMAAARPGVGENEIEALLEYTFLRRGASGAAYGHIVAGGPNACILHYRDNNRPLVDGELLLIDAGAEFDGYASDVTRTFPVNGRFTPAQRELYDVVLRAQLDALAHVRAGVSFVAVHEVAVRTLCEGLVQLGLLAGSVDEVFAKETYKRFYMHRTGHWLGLDVHDCGAYVVAGKSRHLEPGQVLTVEPGLYVAPDDESVDARWRGIGIRIEDDVLVTATGSEILTAAIPKDIDAVERACGAPAARVLAATR